MPAITTALVAGGIAAAGSMAGAGIASSGAQKAGQVQADAAMSAAQLQKQAADQALAFQKQQWNTSQAELAPWLNVGRSGLANIANLLGILPPGTGGQPTTGAVPANAPNVGGPSWNGGDVGGDMPVRGGRFGAMINGGPRNNLRYVNEGPVSGATVQGAQPITDPNNPNVSLSSLVNPDLGATGSLSKGWDKTFSAPTAATEQNDPGYQFRLNEGAKALENSAAARGGLLSGNTSTALSRYAQDYASNEYSKVYDRAINEYRQSYDIFSGTQADKYNRLASMSGVGQVTAGQLGQLGSRASSDVSSILLGSAGQIGQQINNAGAARASGYASSANAWAGAFGGLGNDALMALLLSRKPPATSSGGGGM